MIWNELLAILPILVVMVWAVLLMAVDVFIPAERKGITAILAALGLAAALVVSLFTATQSGTSFNDMAVTDGFSLFLDVIFTGAGLVGVGLAYDYLKRFDLQRGEYYTLMMFSIGGMMLMAHANDLILVFLALELLSIPLYILSGFARPKGASEEAALKYFLLGSFASAFVLYGVAVIFGATASTNLSSIVNTVGAGTANMTFFVIGAALMVIGFGFKVAAVPFHSWTPDVYEGAPTPVTGFMSTAVKAAGFAILLRLFLVLFPSLSDVLTPIVWVLAALTMILGNVVALAQTNIKRMLAYSSIAHAGYLLMGLAAYGVEGLTQQALSSMLFYLAAYGITNLGAWAVVTAAEQAEGRGLALEDYAGLGRKYPWLGVAMMIFMFSFTGVPPTLGFWGKYYLFLTTIQSGVYWLAILGVLTSLVSAYFYLRVVVMMFFREGQGVMRRDVWLNAIAIVASLAVVLLSLLPGSLMALAGQAMMR